MIIVKRFSQTRILGTKNAGLGFGKSRNYDMDLNRLGRMKTSQRELTKIGDLGKEMRELNKELNRGGIGKWQLTD